MPASPISPLSLATDNFLSYRIVYVAGQTGLNKTICGHDGSPSSNAEPTIEAIHDPPDDPSSLMEQ